MRKRDSRWWRRGAAAGAVLAVLGSGLYVSTASGDDKRSAGFEEIIDLIRLARVTAPFHDVQKALDAGWSVEPMCLEYPDGYYGEPPGTMGHHFFSVDYLTDGGRVDASEPELLLYEKRADGSWRFNAVEYIVPARDVPSTGPAPRLFGREFTFFPEVGTAGVWGLHVWLWRSNPHGLYANVNPNVTCEHSGADLTHTHH
jgi:hypothetical protein